MDWTPGTADLLSAAAPWRTFRRYRGQKHYSGTYWSSTEQSHVIYESRLELARLLYADFDGAVRRNVAQPFLLKAKVGKRVCGHVPDFALLTKQGPVIVDVKPRARLSDPRIGCTLDWTRELVEERRWRYEVRSSRLARDYGLPLVAATPGADRSEGQHRRDQAATGFQVASAVRISRRDRGCG